jgi:hypothetical protein
VQRRGLAAYSNGTSPFCCGRFGPTGGQYREVCLGEVWCLFNVARTVISAKPFLDRVAGSWCEGLFSPGIPPASQTGEFPKSEHERSRP